MNNHTTATKMHSGKLLIEIHNDILLIRSTRHT